MMKLSIVVDPSTTGAVGKQRRFLLIVDSPEATLQGLSTKIRNHFGQLYPQDFEDGLQIKKLQTSTGEDLILSYAVRDVFKEGDDVIVHSISEERERESSIPPTSSLRPRPIKKGGPKKKRDAIPEEDSNSIVGTPKSIDSVVTGMDNPTTTNTDAKSNALARSPAPAVAEPAPQSAPKAAKKPKAVKEAAKKEGPLHTGQAATGDTGPVKKKVGRPPGSGNKKATAANGVAQTAARPNEPVKSVEAPAPEASHDTIVPNPQVIEKGKAAEPKKRQKTSKAPRAVKSPPTASEVPSITEDDKTKGNKRPYGLMSPSISHQESNTDTGSQQGKKAKRPKGPKSTASPVPAQLPSEQAQKENSNGVDQPKAPVKKVKAPKAPSATTTSSLEKSSSAPRAKKRKAEEIEDTPTDGTKKPAKKSKANDKSSEVTDRSASTKPAAKPKAAKPKKGAPVVDNSDEEGPDGGTKSKPKKNATSKAVKQEKPKKELPKEPKAKVTTSDKSAPQLTNGVAKPVPEKNASEATHISAGDEETDGEYETDSGDEQAPPAKLVQSTDNANNEVKVPAAVAKDGQAKGGQELEDESEEDSSDDEEEYVEAKTTAQPPPPSMPPPKPKHEVAQSQPQMLTAKNSAPVKAAISNPQSSSEDSSSGTEASSDDDSDDDAANSNVSQKKSTSRASLGNMLGFSWSQGK